MLYKKIQDAANLIKKKVKSIPSFGVILGTGLKGLIDEMEVEVEVPYSDIPHFPIPSVVTHGASMIFGKMNGKSVVVLSGRFHYYEGYTMEEVTFGIRVLSYLKVKQLVITNITGSVNPNYKVGEIVMIRDHINLQSQNPLRPQRGSTEGETRPVQKHDERLGLRFPSMLNAYDPILRKLTQQLANEIDVRIHEGVYTAMDGPSLETPSEYRMINILGGDVVGMSTVPEVIVARQQSIRTLVLSIVSNQCFPIESLKEDSIETILNNVEIGVPNLKKLIYALMQVQSIQF